MKILKTVLLFVALLLSSITSAHAMGDREKGALIGAGAVLLLPSLLEGAGNLFGGTPQRSYTTTHYVEQPRYIERPHTTVVYSEPYVRERVIIIDNAPRHRYAPPRHHHPHHSYYREYERDRYYR
ncbi:hypothetical protein [Sulfurospirillum deleyianum]|uniref:Uncharacterized protein n=1 Tax=Sulfurospirillum deleyianum (strain ATCC 51133 / DSM 6946 / 5175) TaxID=525898 RepID=D1AZ10_SULD5|nr:hypothetical protein [Sulfurospirillum deleyianum]ACZ11148.1 hypothetical protein Sdel_0110 [Sulfurospirillum deleyianum DSM 6946]